MASLRIYQNVMSDAASAQPSCDNAAPIMLRAPSGSAVPVQAEKLFLDGQKLLHLLHALFHCDMANIAKLLASLCI